MPIGDDWETLGGSPGTEEEVEVTCPQRSGFKPIKQARGRTFLSETTWDNITTFWDVVGGERLTFWDAIYGDSMLPLKQTSTTFRRTK